MTTKSSSALPNIDGSSLRTSDLEGLLLDLGLTLDSVRTNDEEIYGLCPGHKRRVGREDRNPGWSINRETQEHSCWSCHYSGSLQALVIDVLGVSVFAANRFIREHGVLMPGVRTDFKPVEAPVRILPESMLAKFHAPSTIALVDRDLSAESAALYGVLWDRSHQNWILPIRNPLGDLWGWQAKAWKGRYFNNYPAAVPKSRTVFGIDVFPEGKPAILVESPLDAVRIHTAGWDGAVSSYGSGVSDRQVKLLMQFTDEIVVALDNDHAGKSMTASLKKRYGSQIRMRYFNYGDTDGKDPGEMTDEAISYGIDTASGPI